MIPGKKRQSMRGLHLAWPALIMSETKKQLLAAACAIAAISACVLGAGAGCSSSATAPEEDAGASDAKLPKLDASDAGEPDTGKPAFPAAHPAAPQVLSLGGPVLATPRFVPIVFAGDPEIANISKLMKSIAPSAYWKATTSEYGVGEATASEPIIVTDNGTWARAGQSFTLRSVRGGTGYAGTLGADGYLLTDSRGYRFAFSP